MAMPAAHRRVQLGAALAALAVCAGYALSSVAGGAFAPLRGLPAAPELVGSFAPGVALAALALVLAVRRPGWVGPTAVTVMAFGFLAFVRTLQGAGLAGGDGTESDGRSLLGAGGLAFWLLGAGVHLWCVTRPRWVSSVVSLAIAAVQCMALCAAWAFMLVCRLIFGEFPGSTVLVSLPALLVVSLLTAGLTAAAWASGRSNLLYNGHVYRWTFARGLSLLLTSTVVSGLAGAGVVAVYSAEALSDSLVARAQRLADSTLRYVQRIGHTVDLLAQHHDLPAAHEATPRGDFPALREDLRQLGEARVAAPPQALPAGPGAFAPDAVLPVLRTARYRAGLLPDGGVQVEFPAESDHAGLLVQLRLPGTELPGRRRDRGRDVLPARLLLCATQDRLQLRCADAEAAAIGLPRAADDERWQRQHFPGPDMDALTLQPERRQDGHRSLRAIAPVGALGSFVVLEVGASTLFTAVGMPLLVAMAGLSVLSLLGACWSLWRQLPTLRDQALALAQTQAMMHHMPLAMLLLDDQGTVRSANTAAARLWQRPAEALCGQALRTLAPDGSLDDRADGDGRASWTTALPLNGGQVPVEARLAHFEHHGAKAALLMLRDLRDEQRAASELQRWVRVFHESGWGMAIGSAREPVVYELVNPAYARMLGYLPSELTGQPVAACVAPSCRGPLAEARRRCETEGHVRAETRHLHRDGHEFPTLVDISLVRDPQGRAEYFVVSVQDISELKQAESQLRQGTHLLRSMLEALPVGIWIGDLQGRVQQTNAAAMQLWCSRPPAPGTPAWWLAPGVDRANHESLLRRSATTGQRIDGGTVEVPAASGERRTILTTASPIVDEAGRPIGAVAVDEDLTVMQRREQALQQLSDRLERILAASAVGMAVCDAGGEVMRTNVAWDALIGPPPQALNADALISAADPWRQPGLIRRICEAQLPAYFGEHRLRRANGELAWTLVVVTRLTGAGHDEPAQALVQVLDIDARRRAAQALAASQSRLAAAQRLAGIGDWVWTLDDDEVECSDELLHLLGFAAGGPHALARETLLARVHADDRDRLRRATDTARQSTGRLDADCRCVRPDGSEIEIHVQGVRETTATRPTMIGTIQDVTERKHIERDLRHSQERLRELAAHEGRAIEEERKRIAREVHDELGQLLTGLRMDLALLRPLTEADTAARERAARMKQTIGRMTEVVRHVASNLRPAALDLGLSAAIEWLAEDFGHRWELQCEFEGLREGEPRLPEAVALALFRAVQESLTNIARHAGAHSALIRLAGDDDELLLTVIDDGHGFDVDAVTARADGGLGLLGMRERMLAIGAHLAIRSGPGGTTIDIRCPLRAAPTP